MTRETKTKLRMINFRRMSTYALTDHRQEQKIFKKCESLVYDILSIISIS